MSFHREAVKVAVETTVAVGVGVVIIAYFAKGWFKSKIARQR